MANKKRKKIIDPAGNVYKTSRGGRKTTLKFSPDEQYSTGKKKEVIVKDRRGRVKKVVDVSADGNREVKRYNITQRQAAEQSKNPQFAEEDKLPGAKYGRVIKGKTLRRSYTRRKQT